PAGEMNPGAGRPSATRAGGRSAHENAAEEVGVIVDEAADRGEGGAVERPGLRAAGGRRADQQVDLAVVAEFGRRHRRAAGEAGVEGEGVARGRLALAAVRLAGRRPAGAGAGDDVGVAVAVQVAGRHEGPALERRVVGEERAELGAGLAVEDL